MGKTVIPILATTHHGLRSQRWLCSRSIPRQWFDLLHRWRRKQNRRDSTSWLCFSWISIRWMRLLPILSNFKHFCLSFFLPSNIFQSIISFSWLISMIHYEFICANCEESDFIYWFSGGCVVFLQRVSASHSISRWTWGWASIAI